MPEIINILKWEFTRNQEKLVDEFSIENFLCGEKFLVPDILLVHCLVWAKSMDFPICDRLIKYLDKLSCRPAYQKAFALR